MIGGMNIFNLVIKLFAWIVSKKIRKTSDHAAELQLELMQKIVDQNAGTRFGKDHKFSGIKSYADFKQQVPIRHYEDLKEYTEKMVAGQEDVLVPGKAKYYAVTSGTTSGAKYIPATSASMKPHLACTKFLVARYINQIGSAKVLSGKSIALTGSPTLEDVNGVPMGRGTGISNLHLPNFIKRRKYPSYEVNCIEDWDLKMDAILDEIIDPESVTSLAGITPWIQMFCQRVIEKYQVKNVIEHFPNLELILHGGVNFGPYRETLRKLIGADISYMETFAASEGFFAFQDELSRDDLLLCSDSGIFFEFIPMDEYGKENPTRLTLSEVELDVNYALILSNLAGLYAYDIGDTVRFTSLSPYRIKITGRTKHYISAFGEHVIVEEIEDAFSKACAEMDLMPDEFTVAPQFFTNGESGRHHWYIETDQAFDSDRFSQIVHRVLRERNLYYRQYNDAGVLKAPAVSRVKLGSFHQYMESVGKLGGQNKIPHVKNDRTIADYLVS
jgi:hypothetical protein